MKRDNGVPSDWKQRVVKLPPHVVDSDAKLHALARRALRYETVRSVTVDGARTAALVCFWRPPSGEAVDEIAATLAANSVEATRPDDVWPEIVTWADPVDRAVSFVRMPERARGWRKPLYLLLAGFFLLMGLVGIVLPGLPTTPFVLLGSYFLLRSSARLHHRLISSRLFGGILRDWHVHRGVRPHVRAWAIAVVAIVVLVSLGVTRPPWTVTAVIAALVACGLIVIWRLPSVREAEFSTLGE